MIAWLIVIVTALAVCQATMVEVDLVPVIRIMAVRTLSIIMV
jgi:hypothetical protein